MSILHRVSFGLLLLFFILGTTDGSIASFHPPIDNDHTHIQLLGLNDFHGQLDKYQDLSGNKVGGAEYLAAYLKKYKQENEHTLLVHSGDMVGGSPPISSLHQNEPTIEYLNLLNIDVGTPGNHEFDEGVHEMQRLINGEAGAFSGSTTSYCSANIINKRTGNLLFPPYIIKQINGIDIGFIGVVTTETTKFLLPEYKEEIEVIDEVQAINQTAEILKKKGITSIVVLAHISAKSGKTGENPHEDLAKMAPQMDDEVDVIFGGHNHAYANTTVDNKLIVQAYSYGKAFSEVRLTINRHTKKIIHKEATIIPTVHRTIKPDQETLTLLKKYKKRIAPYMNKIISKAPKEITRKQKSNGESPLAKIIAESGRNILGADIAFYHHGGIRASLNEGTITKEDLYTALPFHHRFVKITLTGKQIKTALEQQWTKDEENRLQAVGLTYTWDNAAPIGSRIITLKDIYGKEIQSKKAYTIAISNYLASGGDGFTAFTKGKLVEDGPLAVDALASYLQQRYPAEVAKY